MVHLAGSGPNPEFLDLTTDYDTLLKQDGKNKNSAKEVPLRKKIPSCVEAVLKHCT